jgi:hypothetical protein
MTTEEWLSLRPGDVISNQQGTNWRVVLSFKNGSIRLPTDRDWAGKGYTVYCRGDKYLFKKTPLKVKLRTMSWTITTTAQGAIKS